MLIPLDIDMFVRRAVPMSWSAKLLLPWCRRRRVVDLMVSRCRLILLTISVSCRVVVNNSTLRYVLYQKSNRDGRERTSEHFNISSL